MLLQENKKLIQVRIRDSDYFDVDFTFQNARTEPKAIYIKHKYFKDVNPELLNPENPLVSNLAAKASQDSLGQ